MLSGCAIEASVQRTTKTHKAIVSLTTSLPIVCWPTGFMASILLSSGIAGHRCRLASTKVIPFFVRKPSRPSGRSGGSNGTKSGSVNTHLTKAVIGLSARQNDRQVEIKHHQGENDRGNREHRRR